MPFENADTLGSLPSLLAADARLMKTILLVCFAATIAQGCALLGGDSSPRLLPVAQLIAAPDTLVFGSQRLVLETHMWRDFQPISPSDGKPLIAIFRVVSVDSSTLSEALDYDAAWVVHDKDIWATYFSDEDPPPSEILPFQLFHIARDGPKWGPGVTVTAVVRIRDGASGVHLLRASHQYIQRTE